MSEVGSCSRALGAKRLGYEPTTQSPQDIARLNHYSRLEAVAAAQITDLGYKVEHSTKCQTCFDRYGTTRYGNHVEIDTVLFQLIGHLDRRLILNDRKLPIEIKSLGKPSWTRFQREHFSAFAGYAGQECAYLEAEKQPGIYWVMDRDSGDSLKYIVNDFNNEVSLTGFERINLPITFSSIKDKLNQIEIFVQDNVLPDIEESNDCFWCRYSYLCHKKDKETKEDKGLKMETIPLLVEMAEDYKYALELEKTAAEIKSNAKDILLQHCKQNNLEKYRCSGLSVSYRGLRTKEYLDTGSLKKLKPEIYSLFVKYSEPYDDYTIRMLKE